MDQQLVDDILTGDSDEIADLKANLTTLEGFVDLAREISSLSYVQNRFYEESRSLFQTTAVGRKIEELEKLLTKFFGNPIKASDKALPRKQRKSSVVKYLGGIQKDQSLFIVSLKTGHFYGALWPWRRNKSKIEIHLGYCSDWMTDDDSHKLETLVRQCISHDAFEQMDASIGGQIHGISLPSFLQMSEMEKSTFTLRVTSRHRVGLLHLNEGELVAAELDEFTGTEAAYRVISWEDASIDIEPLSTSKTGEIHLPLMHVLMESLKLKDEAVTTQEKPPPMPKGRPKAKGRRTGPARPGKRLVRLERAPTPEMRRKRLPFIALAGVAVGIFAVISVIVIITFHVLDSRSTSDGYQNILSRVEKAESLQAGIKILESFREAHPGSVHSQSIEAKIKELRVEIEDRDYEQATLKVSALPVDEQYETTAINLFSAFLKKYPDSRHTQKINEAIGEIKNLLDKYYYEELVRAARLDFNQRLEIYKNYLSQFPDGSYRRDVEVLIREMGAKYLSYLQDETTQCEAKRSWEPCIRRCDNFIDAYPDKELAEKAMDLKRQLIDKRDYYQLLSQAENTGNDYQKAYQIYRAYLAEHPESTQKDAVQKEVAALKEKLAIQQKWTTVQAYATDPKNDIRKRMARVDRYLRDNASSVYAGDAQSLMGELESERQARLRQHQAQAKLREERARAQRRREEQARRKQRAAELQARLEVSLNGSERYRPNGNGTVTDRNTGLMWTLLDSQQAAGKCMDFTTAQQYVRTLTDGGHRDWRLPSASELSGLYKQPPFFPGSGAQWYWSYEAYVKGYHSVVDVVTSKPETVYQRESRSQDECGAVRAVRATTP